MRSLKDIKLSVTKHPRAVTHPTSSISVRALVILKDKQVSYRHEPASSFPRLVKNKEFPQEFSCARMEGASIGVRIVRKGSTTLRRNPQKRIKIAMKSTGYPPPHTTHKTSALKVKASVLATLLALPLSAYSFNVPQIKIPELPSLNSPDFEDNSGFIENTLPVQSYRYQALDAEGLQKQIDSSSSNYLLKYTSLGSNWESKRLINIDGENNSVNAGQKDLRFYQTIEDESLRVTRKSNLSLNTEGDIQFYGEDLLRLIYSDSNSTLSIQSNNIWLNHKITDINSNYGSVIYGNTNSNTSFTTTNDFVAIIDASEIQTFKNRDYSIIRGSSLSINSSNIYVIQNLHDSAQNSISTGIDLYGGNPSSESSLNASSNIFIQGVNTGIYSEIALNVSAKDFVINTNSYKDLHGTGSSSNNTGIHAKKHFNYQYR